MRLAMADVRKLVVEESSFWQNLQSCKSVGTELPNDRCPEYRMRLTGHAVTGR